MTVDEAIRDAADSFATGMCRVEIHVDMARRGEYMHVLWESFATVEDLYRQAWEAADDGKGRIELLD